MTATFANGTARELDIDDRDILLEDRVFELDLPGARRDVVPWFPFEIAALSKVDP